MRLLRLHHLYMIAPRVKIHEHLRQASLDHIAQPLSMHLSNGGGWRHTFYLPCRECIVTLEDAAILLGLRIYGLPVMGSTNPSTKVLQDMCVTWRPTWSK